MTVVISSAAVDKRMCTPADVLAQSTLTALADAEVAADVASDLAAQVVGRPPWRERVEQRLVSLGNPFLALERFPPEGLPAVKYTDDGDAIETTDYFAIGDPVQLLQRRSAVWGSTALTGTHLTAQLIPDSEQENWIVGPDWAGYLMPGQIAEWAGGVTHVVGGSTSYGDAAGGWVSATDRSIPVLFEVTTVAGATTTEPTWDTAAGNTTTDSAGNVFTARAAQKLPPRAERAALLIAVAVVEQLNLAGSASMIEEGAQGGGRVKFRRDLALAVPPLALQMLEGI